MTALTYRVSPWAPELRHGRSGISGMMVPPADKSISHRALIFAALAEGNSTIRNLLASDDVVRTRTILTQLGVSIVESKGTLTVAGKGLRSFSAPADTLYCGNSGTTMRLLMGLL